jgi:hypothetical protein
MLKIVITDYTFPDLCIEESILRPAQERMTQMIPTFDEDLKQPRNAALFEKTSREAPERPQTHSNT